MRRARVNHRNFRTHYASLEAPSKAPVRDGVIVFGCFFSLKSVNECYLLEDYFRSCSGTNVVATCEQSKSAFKYSQGRKRIGSSFVQRPTAMIPDMHGRKSLSNCIRCFKQNSVNLCRLTRCCILPNVVPEVSKIVPIRMSF